MCISYYIVYTYLTKGFKMTHNALFEGDLMLFTFLADGETIMQH